MRVLASFTPSPRRSSTSFALTSTSCGRHSLNRKQSEIRAIGVRADKCVGEGGNDDEGERRKIGFSKVARKQLTHLIVCIVSTMGCTQQSMRVQRAILINTKAVQ